MPMATLLRNPQLVPNLQVQLIYTSKPEVLRERTPQFDLAIGFSNLRTIGMQVGSMRNLVSRTRVCVFPVPGLLS